VYHFFKFLRASISALINNHITIPKATNPLIIKISSIKKLLITSVLLYCGIGHNSMFGLYLLILFLNLNFWLTFPQQSKAEDR